MNWASHTHRLEILRLSCSAEGEADTPFLPWQPRSPSHTTRPPPPLPWTHHRCSRSC
jgi:hypothetical protein